MVNVNGLSKPFWLLFWSYLFFFHCHASLLPATRHSSNCCPFLALKGFEHIALWKVTHGSTKGVEGWKSNNFAPKANSSDLFKSISNSGCINHLFLKFLFFPQRGEKLEWLIISSIFSYCYVRLFCCVCTNNLFCTCHLPGICSSFLINWPDTGNMKTWKKEDSCNFLAFGS